MQLTSNEKELLHKFGWAQLQHDRYFHVDIYTLNTQDMLKHFTMHFVKYQARIFDVNGNVDVKNLTDIFIIAVATSNACKVATEKFWSSVNLPPKHVQDEYTLLKMMVNATSRLAKVCEGLDHVEDQNFVANIKSGISEIMEVVHQLCHWGSDQPISLETLILIANSRLVEVELNHPMFLELKTKHFNDKDEFCDWYQTYVCNPTVSYLKAIQAGVEYKHNQLKTDRINQMLSLRFLKFATKGGMLTTESNGKFALTQRGLNFINDRECSL